MHKWVQQIITFVNCLFFFVHITRSLVFVWACSSLSPFYTLGVREEMEGETERKKKNKKQEREVSSPLYKTTVSLHTYTHTYTHTTSLTACRSTSYNRLVTRAPGCGSPWRRQTCSARDQTAETCVSSSS